MHRLLGATRQFTDFGNFGVKAHVISRAQWRKSLAFLKDLKCKINLHDISTYAIKNMVQIVLINLSLLYLDI